MKSLKCGMICLLLFLFLSVPVAAVQISPLPEPPSSAKLRIFTVVLTTEHKYNNGRVSWWFSPEEFENWNKMLIRQKLKNLGYYEIVNDLDVKTVLQQKTISAWEWKSGDWKLVKEAGKALHADYVLIFERSMGVNLQYDTRLLNLRTGKQFEASNYLTPSLMGHMSRDERMRAGGEVVQIHYRQIFQEAKGDLLQTAIFKGKLVAKSSVQPASVTSKEKDISGQPPTKAAAKEDRSASKPEGTIKPTSQPEVKEASAGWSAKEQVVTGASASAPVQTKVDVPEDRVKSNKQLKFEREFAKALNDGTPKTDAPRLVVYDFDAAERMKVVGLILTEALREELYYLGGFVLVNRESILKIIDEYKLQQTSLVDEKQVVAVGKWLAANEAVTGQLGVLGHTSILQAKRVDIKTMGTLSVGSLKCPEGREDELLDKMPELAQKLVLLSKGK